MLDLLSLYLCTEYEAAQQSWSVRTLERNINTFYYHRLLSSDNKIPNQEDHNKLEKQQPEDFIKDPYIFEFLNIQQPATANESEIETALIENLQQFLLELGKVSPLLADSLG